MNLKELLNRKTAFIIACASIAERERAVRALRKHGVAIEGSMYAVELWVQVAADRHPAYAMAMIPCETEEMIYEFEDLDLAEPEDLDLNPPLTC